jgi:hypothetical protein
MHPRLKLCMQHANLIVQTRVMQDANNNIVFISGIYVQSSGQNSFNRKKSLGGPRFRWEDNIKVDEHSSL